MADILIRGMEMPKDGTYSIVHIYSDGHISMPCWGKGMQIVSGITAVPLPEGHGRLIDGDALYEVAKTRSMGIYGPCDFQCVITGNDIIKAHTIVPIGGGEDG